MPSDFKFHSSSVEECLKELDTGRSGISQVEAEKRNQKYGLNKLPRQKPLGAVLVFFSQFNNPLVYILLFTGALSMILGEYINSGVIFAAVFINVVIGFFQENKANQAIVKLRELVEHKSLVVRGEQEMNIDSELVAPGDLIIVQAGNRIPADARLIEAAELQVNEASLTGESIPSKKSIEAVPTGASLADRENMVFAGTVAVNGRGLAVVCSIGPRTEVGKIAEMVKTTREEKTPLQLRLARFSRLLGMLFGLVCLMIVIIGLAQSRPFLEMLETGVAVGVASIPEGLTVAITFILALGMQQILKKKALTRKLIATETLGSTSVICSDKTGTLTEGKMHVAHIIIGEKEFEPSAPGTRQDRSEARSASLALQVGMMCNDAFVENPEDELGSWRFVGSPTETALLSAAIQSGLNRNKLLEAEPQIDELPFDSARKYMISLHRAGRREYVLYEKGAPEILLEKSSHFHHLGRVIGLDTEEKARLIKTYEKLTARGLRVIGLAQKRIKIPAGKSEIEEGRADWDGLDRGLTFVGFIAIKDPLRPEAADTIKTAIRAGIRPVIITGDHRLTAAAIAREVGLKAEKGNLITGPELDEVSDEDLLRLSRKIEVYARVSPHHKLRIVKALQSRGEVVAMTGDGINDSPALKAADIGISLGTGTDIAKETSDIVLLDNNFQTIVAAIRQGRVIFKNIRKVITYLISDSFSEVILIVGSIMIGSPLAILPTQILWINIINDGLPHFSLAFEKGDEKIMTEKPTAKKEPLLNREMKMIIFGAGIARDLITFSIFYYLWLRGISLVYLQTLMFATLGVKSLISIFSIRALRRPIWTLNPLGNRYLVMAVGASFFLLLAGIYFGPLQTVLSTTPLHISGWAIAFIIGFTGIMLIELVKILFGRRPSPAQPAS